MSKYIKNLIRQGENQHLDFKFEISDSKKIARTFSAFANTGGGTLLIGVKDNGKIKGVQTEEEIYMVESAAHLFCKPKVEYSTEHWQVDGCSVLEVKIPESKNIPHYAPGKDDKWVAYIRVQDQNFVANNIQVKVWKNKTRKKGTLVKYQKEEQLLMKYLKENDSISFSRFCKIANINRYIAEKILVNLISVNIIKIIYKEEQIFYQLTK